MIFDLNIKTERFSIKIAPKHIIFDYSWDKKETNKLFRLVCLFWRRWFIRSARFRARRHAHGRRNSHRLFLCFATAFSNLSACTNKKSRRQKAVGIFGADGSFARLASALADTHTAVETATGCFFASQPPFRISPPAPIKNPVGKKPSGFLAQMERFELSRRLPTLRP